jgi:phage terminase large subunit-like protein
MTIRAKRYPELKRKVIEHIHKHNPRIVLIEDKASGTQLIQDLKTDGQYRVKPHPPPPQTDKVMRLHAQTAKSRAASCIYRTQRPGLPNPFEN